MPNLNPEFATNAEPRCPYVLLLDTSGSMGGPPIKELNQGLQIFRESLKDPTALLRVEIAIVTFDSNVKLVQDFVTAYNFDPPILTAQGGTDMTGGIQKALDLLQSRKALYKSNKVACYRPWVFMITDGEPNDGCEPSARRLRDAEKNDEVAFFAVGVEGANMTRLKDIVVRPPFQLRGLNFQGLFLWLSSSLTKVSHSREGEQLAMQAPGGDIIV
ncbi:MAG: vWA domain-containing protein [Methylococcales bacterium]